VTAPIRVLVVDDHRMFAQAIESLLSRDERFEIIGTVGRAEEGLELVKDARPHVILLDLNLPGMHGVEATRLFKACCPGTAILILSAFDDTRSLAKAIEAGASGFVPKTQAVEDLISVIEAAVRGDMVLPAGQITRILEAVRIDREAGGREERGVDQLTQREIQILEVLAEGRATAEIADQLFISRNTVQSHVNSILMKLGARSRLEAVTIAYRNGVIVRQVGP
jgi:NarL family two-component system response regulator LiaR